MLAEDREARSPPPHIHIRSLRDTQRPRQPLGQANTQRHIKRCTHAYQAHRQTFTYRALYTFPKYTHTNTAPLREEADLQDRVGVPGPERPKCGSPLPQRALSIRGQ